MSSVGTRVNKRSGFRRTDDIAALVKEFASPDAIEREVARKSLAAIGKPAVHALVEALSNPNDQVRWEAAKALTCIADPAAVPALVAALGDERTGVRWLAAEALAAQGRASLDAVLKALTDPARVSWLREGAHHVLHELTRRESTEWLKPVLKALEDFEPGLTVPLAALGALRALRASSRRTGA